jgi:uncharacterized protein (DUF1684 family)
MTALIVLLSLLAPGPGAYLQEMAEWRKAREERLKSETSWLTVVGLHWLQEGENTVGSSPSSAVRLPPAAPPSVGVIRLAGRKAEFAAAKGVPVTSKGKPVDRLVLDEETPIELGSITFFVIERGSRVAVRVRDANAAARREFAGLSWYDADPRWRLRARFVAPATARKIPIATIVGDEIDLDSAGELVFTVNGRELRMEALYDSPERSELYIMFKDRTNGKTTYGAGRYMYLPLPVNGTVDLDFNKAYNPPCAYTDYATCPLPPRQNWLPVPIEAGEKVYKTH